METRHTNDNSTQAGRRTAQPTKHDLIRLIRIKEGNYACFAAPGSARCDQGNCPWRRHCLNVAQ